MNLVVKIIIGVLLFLLVAFFAVTRGLSDIKKMLITSVDLTKVPDGVYRGEFKKVRWHYEVEVTVQGGKITSITNINKIDDNSDKEFRDKVIESIINKQSLDIDVVSSATVNTKAFQKAVENALVQSIK